MTYERQEIRDAMKKHDQKLVGHSNQHHLTVVAQSAVPAQLLMADPHWAIYQQQIQHAIETMDANIERLRTKLCSPSLVDPQEMALTKNALLEACATSQAWRVAVALPKQIIDNAEVAKDLLAKVTEKYGNAE